MKAIKEHSRSSAQEKLDINEEIHRLQQLHSVYESHLKKRLKLLKASWPAQVSRDQELRESEELFRTTFQKANVGIAHIGVDGKWLRANKKFCDIVGWSQRDLRKRTFLEIIHPSDHAKDIKIAKKLFAGELTSATMEKRYICKDGSLRWVRATGSIVRKPSGEPKYGIGIIEDIHEGKQRELALQLLAEAGKKITGSVSYQETLKNVAKFTTETFADWCIIDMLESDNELHRVEVAQTQPHRIRLASKILSYTPKTKSKNIVAHVLKQKEPKLFSHIQPSIDMPLFTTDPTYAETLKALAPQSAMIVPLLLRGKPLGVISFFCVHSDRNYTINDLTLVEELVARVSLAIENARLFEAEQKAVQVRDEFLSVASHELKTSLTTVKAFTQILQKTSRENEASRQAELLKKMDGQLNKTTNLINDLLDVSRIHSGAFMIRREIVATDAFMKDIVETCQRIISTHQILLKQKIKETISIDKDRMGQVIMNLITNAVKYSPAGTKIIITLKRKGNLVVIQVKDSGFGIPKEKQRQIFERFYRLVDADHKKVSGLGLGLYICRELVQQHEGTIRVSSKEGKGSTFTIFLPLKTGKTQKGA